MNCQVPSHIGHRTSTLNRSSRPILAAFASHPFHSHSVRRRVQTSQPREQGASLSSQSRVLPMLSLPERQVAQQDVSAAPLSALPLSQILRTWFITSISSSPRLLRASTSMLRTMLESKNPLFSLDRNPVMRAVLWHTFYKQFCAGETPAQVAQECSQLRQQGYAGVILEYAVEVLKDDAGNEAEKVAAWRSGVLETVAIANSGDFVALKWSGMGSAAMNMMKKNQMPSASMAEAMEAVCKAAAAKNVALLPSAEETWTLDGYHNWSLYAQNRFNRHGQCVVYNTYQAYLKRAPEDVGKHLEAAREEGFTLGAKIVRGAYLDSEERSKIWPTVGATHHSYDSIAAALLRKQNNAFINVKSWPNLKVVLATHNADSVKKAQELRRNQIAAGEELVPLAFSQLQGMADEVSCGLLAASKGDTVSEMVFKFTPWGPMHECLNYLLRRAAENKDAAGRTQGTRDAMRAEIWRRIRAALGFI